MIIMKMKFMSPPGAAAGAPTKHHASISWGTDQASPEPEGEDPELYDGYTAEEWEEYYADKNNEDWQDEWGGFLELWDKDMKKCVKKLGDQIFEINLGTKSYFLQETKFKKSQIEQSSFSDPE